MRLVVVLIGILCLMTSCSAQKAQRITEEFTCDIRCQYDGTVYEGTMTRTSPQKTTVTFTQPPSVKGLTMTKTPNGVTVELGGTTYALDSQAQPSGMLVGVLAEAFDAANGETETVISGDGKAGAYTLYFDEQSGTATSLEMKDIPLIVRFSNVKTTT